MLEVSGKIAGEESRAVDLKRKGIIERIAKREKAQAHRMS